MIKAVIFDLDGLLVDSELLHYLTNKIAFRKYGVNITKEFYIKNWIESLGGSNKVINDYKLNVNIGKLRKEKITIYKRLAKEKLKLMPGAVNSIKRLKKIPLGVCSSSYNDDVYNSLDKFKLRKYFKAVTSYDDVKNCKPHPEPYLKTAKKIKVNPKYCLVIEDSLKGMQSAKSAGMKCIVIPKSYTRHEDFSKADLILKSLNELDLKILERF